MKDIIQTSGHDDRRNEVALVTARLIAERGLEGVKLREIATEIGYSTHIVSHYFDSKKELMLFTLRQCAARQVRRLKTAIARDASVAECLETLLPLDEARMVDGRVWMVFWAQTLSDEDIIAEQRDFGQRWRRLLVGMMRIRGFFTAETPRATRDFVAQQLQSAVAGIGIHGALGVWSADRQRQILAEQVRMILQLIEQPIGQSQTPAAAEVPPDPSARDLVIENARLRKLLVDAMLQIETLNEAHQADEIVRLRPASTGA